MRRYLSLLILLITTELVVAQVSIPGDVFGRLDKMDDTTTLTFYKSIDQNLVTESFEVLDPYVKLSYNSQYPRGYNDGPVWKGVGLTTEVHGGFAGNQGKFSYMFHPTVFFSQNGDFNLAQVLTNGSNPYVYQFGLEGRSIDWVQRYGQDPFLAFHPGQSHLSFDFGKVTTSVSTQNYSVGPSTFNPILLSRQAGGFPHFRLGLDPVELKIRKKNLGKVEANFLVGLLSESDYFDTNSNNDRRYFNGLFFAYSPSFLPEVKLGVNKVLYKDTQFFEPGDLISTLIIVDSGMRGDSIDTNDTFDQMASITLDWNFPSVGFRAYAEYAKNDFTSSNRFRFTATEPEHTRAFTLGFEKELILKKGGTLNIQYEHTNLARNQAFLWRATPTYYMHHINDQGYTNDGQILGAGIGPGGNSDHLLFRLEKEDKKIDLLFQRIEANRDYFVVNIQNLGSHDIEYSAGLSYQKTTPKMVFAVEGAYSFTYNRYYLRDRSNLYFGASSRFRL